VFAHIGADRARTDCVAGDSGLDGFQRDNLGQAQNTVLGCGVTDQFRRADQRIGRCGVDDPAPVARPHLRQHRADRVKRRRQIDRQHLIPFLRRESFDRLAVLDAGIVDQDIDLAQPVVGIGDHRHDGGGVAHIGVVIKDRHGKFGRQTGAQFLYRRGVVKTVQHDRATLRRQRPREPEPDPANRAGNNRCLALQTSRHGRYPSFRLVPG